MAKGLHATPGRFVLAAFFAGPQYQGCGQYHPYTISAFAPNGNMALGIKALGDCTRQLQSIRPGAEARLQGPFGSFFSEVTGPSLWVAGGIGITPFIAALRNGPLAHPVHLICLFREGADAPCAQELGELASPLLQQRGAAAPRIHFERFDFR
jgi:predicted ferric reductase